MKNQEFVDYYEILEVSVNATSETIEKIFRYLASKAHPDVAGDASREQFNQMVEAYKVLRDPAARVKYDTLYAQNQEKEAELLDAASNTENDTNDRTRILSLFYAQRKRDMKQPGVGIMKIAQLLGIPDDIIEFHLWYMRDKGWVEREDSGLLSITAEGVDEIESRNQNSPRSERFITYESDNNGEASAVVEA